MDGYIWYIIGPRFLTKKKKHGSSKEIDGKRMKPSPKKNVEFGGLLQNIEPPN